MYLYQLFFDNQFFTFEGIQIINMVYLSILFYQLQIQILFDLIYHQLKRLEIVTNAHKSQSLQILFIDFLTLEDPNFFQPLVPEKEIPGQNIPRQYNKPIKDKISSLLKTAVGTTRYCYQTGHLRFCYHAVY
ncbi:hypothetical protein BpHYR1_033275 [Brachionus plicatilis]|uniref:Uncharacterized protein n=1 Tax=Brachionus plicatilis TaxID=10195 RepID=A0A3M7R0E0_BRAPC|nr:hypothetical protein BpHYR1_033275 [Brachionus plicatilis]